MGGLVWIRPVHNRTPQATKATVAAKKTTIKKYIMRLTGSLNLRLTSHTHPPTKQYCATLSFKKAYYIMVARAALPQLLLMCVHTA
jgi:hypothetical protein